MAPFSGQLLDCGSLRESFPHVEKGQGFPHCGKLSGVFRIPAIRAEAAPFARFAI